MDVSELLAPDPGNSARTTLLYAIAVIALVSTAVSGLLYCTKPGLRVRTQRYSFVFFVLFLAFTSAGGYSRDSEKPDHSVAFESELFAAYGFTAESPRAEWRRLVKHGETGYVTTLNRDGRDQTVRILVEDGKLTITGPDGREIPANT